MAAMAQNSELTLFVTHVETEGPLLKIWGQIDRHAVTRVERMIMPLGEEFAQGIGVPMPGSNLPTGLICCARFQNEGYYRAKVCRTQPDGTVLVHFIDYGNYEVLPPSAIGLLEHTPSGVPLQALPPLAFAFILANVMAANGGWEMETVESIKQTLRYADIKGEFHSTVGNHRLIKLCYNNEDFGELLVSKKLAIRASVQEMFAMRRPVLQNRPQHYGREPMPQSQVGVYPPRVQIGYSDRIPRQNAPPEDWRSRQAPTHVEALEFKSRVLDVGSVHEVYVSYVEDGPMTFSVQVQSTSEILQKLMADIHNCPKSPLQEPPLPGSVCLGRYSFDGVLCRAVVMSVMEQKCKVFYVDFGHKEVLSYSDIFQLPPQYINPRVLSIRFTLSGLKDMVITQATKDYFKKIVSGKTLVLQVRPPEGHPLMQYGELYDNGTSIRDILREKCDVALPALYQEPPTLHRGFKDLVHVSFVESCTKFFVQLDSAIKSLNSVMACLEEYAKNAPQLDQAYLKVGWPCCALYANDMHWYRAQILSVKEDQVAVLYVDYGNEEVVAASSLRKIHNDLVTNLRAQAIRCVLNGFHNSPVNQELSNQFELLVLEKKLAMEVIAVQPNNSLVDLFDCEVNPRVSIASKLQFPNGPNPGATINGPNAHSQGEQALNSSRSQDSKYQKTGKPNTWGQESVRSTEGSARNQKYEQNNHEDKIRTKNFKDVENEQRQRENNRHDGEDRLHQKETQNNNFFNRNDPASRRGGGNRFGNSRDDNRSFDRSMNKDDSWSDRDSDSSSRGSGKRGSKGPRGIKGRDKKQNSGKWSDGGDSDRSGQGSGFRSRDRNSPNRAAKNSKTQPNKSGSWNSMSPTSPIKEPPRVQKLRIPPPNITVGAVKNVEVIYTDSPTDFYVQLCPDNLELDKVMENIAKTYASGGSALRRSDMQPGNCCIAQYSEDSKWYRATIKSNNADSANVHFTDYGNSESVPHDKIKEIQAEFAKLSAQAVRCKLFAAAKSTWSDEEIDRFSQSAEGISLEAEFLAQQNEVYDVLIKPAAPGDADYVNKLFCGDVDLAQAKQDLKGKGSKGSPKKKREVVARQYISAGEKWGDEKFADGYQVDVVVTWFVNPNNFYCQIMSRQSEFRNMMNNIQESYVGQQPIKNKLQVGDPVIAFFSDDGALYRAEIKEMNKLRGHIVQYVDFGNCAMVDPCKIYPVEKRFAVLSKQAMHCTLKNVSPAQGANWSKANKHEIDKYFDADKYSCTFQGTKDGKYSILLYNNGKNIAEAMIAAGLAIDSEAKVETGVSTPVGEQKAAQDEKLDPNLWNGQIVRTRVEDADGAAKFCIQLPPESGNHLVECFLINVNPSPQVDDALKKAVEGNEIVVRIKTVNNNNLNIHRFGVQLYDKSGKRLKIAETDTEDRISPVCPLPISKSTCKVWVTHIENSENIWLQRSSDSDNIADLLASLYEFYSTSGSPFVPEVGKSCVAESSDKNWYRGVTEAVESNDEAEVRFIDYGNTEKVALDAVKILDQKFYTPHELAIRVSLVVKLKGSDEEQKTVLHDNLYDKELTATFHNVGNNWLVELVDDEGKKISEKLSELDLVAEFKDTQQEIPEMIVGNRYQVFLSHSDSPAQFWLQRQEEVEAIEAMQASLQIAAPNFTPTSATLEEGTLCAALYSYDNLWYRAEVLDADEDITTVRFIDYGNTDVINSNSSSIKELPQSWKSIKKYGLKSRLDLVPTGSEDWSSASCEVFESMATATEAPITALIIADSVPRRVELFVNGDESIGDSLVKNGHAIMVHDADDLIDELIDVELDPRSAFVSHANSPDEFWVQEEKSVSDLEVMTDRFIVAEMFPKLENIGEGVLCVAKFPDDDQWYRARVNSHSTEGTQVLYIDYGNSAVSTEIRTIPEDLAIVPPLSRKCRLQLPPGVKAWSKKASEKFVELGAEGATIFLLDVESEGETSVVSLTLDGADVAEELAKLCEVLPVIDERLPPLGEENSPNVVVSHVNSPSEFWIQAESNMGELEIMAGRLVEAQSLLPLTVFDEGTICAAQYPEDNEWYRAKIISHGETGTNVLYFDYGNSAVTKELRILPEDVANIPSLATRCTLAVPEEVETWSKEANEKFVELAAEGVTMFQFEILDDKDPTMITLYLNGTDVVDILKPLCGRKENLEVKTEAEVKTEVPEESQEATKEGTETVQTNGDENLPEIKNEIQTENADVEETKINCKVETEESETEAKINGCETEPAQSDIPKDEIVKSTQIPETENGKLVPEKEINESETVQSIQIPETENGKSVPEKEINESETVKSTEIPETENGKLVPEKEINESETVQSIQIPETENEKSVPEKEINDSETVKSTEIPETENGKLFPEKEMNESETVQSIKIPETESGKSVPEKEINESETVKSTEIPETENGKLVPEKKINESETVQSTQIPESENGKSVPETEINESETVQSIKIPETENGKLVLEKEINESETVQSTQIPETENGKLVPEKEMNESETVKSTEIPETENGKLVPEKKINGSETVKSTETPETENGKLLPEKRTNESETESPSPEVEILSDSPEVITLDDSETEEPKNVEKEAEAPEKLTVDDIVGNMVKVDLKEEILELKTGAEDVAKDSVPGTPHKTPIMDKIVPGSISRGSIEEDIPPSVLARRRSSCTEEKIVPGSINKGNDLTEADNVEEILPKENGEAQSRVEHEEMVVPPSPGKTSREDKILPGSVSRGESPTVEISRPTTPKTPHSEKLLAGVVNLQENLSDFEEKDEILTVEVENNIPDDKA